MSRLILAFAACIVLAAVGLAAVHQFAPVHLDPQAPPPALMPHPTPSRY